MHHVPEDGCMLIICARRGARGGEGVGGGCRAGRRRIRREDHFSVRKGRGCARVWFRVPLPSAAECRSSVACHGRLRRLRPWRAELAARSLPPSLRTLPTAPLTARVLAARSHVGIDEHGTVGKVRV